jgi:4-oxalocrotonate tautomerase family enzyme
MPIVEIHILEGYSDSDKTRLARAVSDAVRLVVPAHPDAITVMTHEMATAHYLRGGVTRSPAPALPDPVAVIRAFLGAMERRDLEEASHHLGVGFSMQFPGAAPMSRLQELVEWAAPRYKFVTKTYHGFDLAQGEDAAIVHCHGTLSGVWPDGEAFEGIRFIDRFEVTGGLITRQDVWNDIAETKAQA